MSTEKKIHLIFDNRERKLIQIFSKKEDVTFETKNLDVADILVSEEVAIERKTGFDFIGRSDGYETI